MREQRVFATRTVLSKIDRTRGKCFFVYEGKTEEKYFEAVDNNKSEVGINPLLEMIPIVRSFSEEGNSNPKGILETLLVDIEESRTGNITYKTLMNRIVDYLYEKEKRQVSSISKKVTWSTLESICCDELSKDIDGIIDDVEKDGERIIDLLQKRMKIKNLVGSLSDVIKNGEITYAEDIDRICLIVDRDRESFTEQQYKFVKEKCLEKNIGLYVSNPCFEFWLIMHFDECGDIDVDKMFENSKVTNSKRYSEHYLNEVMKKHGISYKKTHFNTNLLVKNIDKAIATEKKYCEEIDKLMNDIGSNIGKLIEELKCI